MAEMACKIGAGVKLFTLYLSVLYDKREWN